MYSFLFRFLDFVRLSSVPSSTVRDSFFPFTKNFVHDKIKEARVEGMEKGGKEERDVFSKKVNKTKKNLGNSIVQWLQIWPYMEKGL